MREPQLTRHIFASSCLPTARLQLTLRHQCVGQDAESWQHQGTGLAEAPAQAAEKQQAACLHWEVHNPNEYLEQEDIAPQGLQVQSQAVESEAKGKPGSASG